MRKPCCDDKEGTNKGAWSKQEDQKLIEYVKAHGEGCWRSLPTAAGLQRCGKSCRLRWINYLRPDIKRGNFGPDEEDLIIKLHALLGNRWSLIAGRLPGRTDNEVKNYWNSHIRKKLLKMGIDPNNHRMDKNKIIVQQPHHLIIPINHDQLNPSTASSVKVKDQSLAPMSELAEESKIIKKANSNAVMSCLGENSSDLNLCLTVALTSSDGLNNMLVEDINAQSSDYNVANEVQMISHVTEDLGSSPTLILFR